ncbi:YeiH family protein [Moritella sp. Urea-trap-13]|uniref:YeiH family protein n=1 Tax=Moritella sp. Urea-trap-13 TaxID=2058327 RepID=UPI000C336AF1|nr:putative sulfate exporter family transporter [Moritella sp. Urea-trap-13]PKH04856.1 putative sulfate exporter family transporter [Moritella sp. Urea-trap-13]
MFKLFTNYSFQKKDLLFIILGLLCLTPLISSPVALVLGFTLATLGFVPTSINLGTITKKTLAYSIVGLGFGINLDEAIVATKDGLGIIVTSIFCTLILGWFLTKALKIDKKTGYLISAGTAICGGSAIAAVAPAINAKNDQTSLALAVVFILNSVALFVFPVIGHLLEMSQHAFGVWSAIAIHDTSSVVGAASAYGDEALLTATTLKLARALWIIPVAFISALLFKGDSKKITVPFFILFYCFAIFIAYALPDYQVLYQGIFSVSKQVLVMCLFLIGAGITVQKVKDAGVKPLVLGVLLWVVISTSSLVYILYFM